MTGFLRAAAQRAYYSGTLRDFCAADLDAIFGRLARQNDFDLIASQREAWLEQATILQNVLSHQAGAIYLEFIIPRMCPRPILRSSCCRGLTAPASRRWLRACWWAPCEYPNMSTLTCSPAVCRVRRPLASPQAVPCFVDSMSSLLFGGALALKPHLQVDPSAQESARSDKGWISVPSGFPLVAKRGLRGGPGGGSGASRGSRGARGNGSSSVPVGFTQLLRPLSSVDHDVADVRQFSTRPPVDRLGRWNRDAGCE